MELLWVGNFTKAGVVTARKYTKEEKCSSWKLKVCVQVDAI